VKTILQRLGTAVAIIAICTILTANLNAQCGSIFQPQVKPQAWFDGRGAAYRRLLNISDWNDDDDRSIVGMWSFSFISKGNGELNIPDDAVLDHGFAQWHSDGTEITNSNRKPSTGSFCLGVWKKVGRNHFKLNHFALGFDDTIHQSYSNIREDVFLSEDGNSFTGSFSIAIYDIQGNPGPVIKGDVTGKRVKLNTTVPDIV
jgi:hypothetical protein